MLVLLIEKLKEVIIINGNIEITVAEITGSFVKLAIKAPPQISIYREEIYSSLILSG